MLYIIYAKKSCLHLWHADLLRIKHFRAPFRKNRKMLRNALYVVTTRAPLGGRGFTTYKTLRNTFLVKLVVDTTKT